MIFIYQYSLVTENVRVWKDNQFKFVYGELSCDIIKVILPVINVVCDLSSSISVEKIVVVSRVYAGLDTYFFPNLAVGQPSDNMDLSEIDFYLGKMMIFYFLHL